MTTQQTKLMAEFLNQRFDKLEEVTAEVRGTVKLVQEMQNDD
jgi:hypothetical protein